MTWKSLTLDDLESYHIIYHIYVHTRLRCQRCRRSRLCVPISTSHVSTLLSSLYIDQAHVQLLKTPLVITVWKYGDPHIMSLWYETLIYMSMSQMTLLLLSFRAYWDCWRRLVTYSRWWSHAGSDLDEQRHVNTGMAIDPPLLSDHSFVAADVSCLSLTSSQLNTSPSSSSHLTRDWHALDVDAFVAISTLPTWLSRRLMMSHRHLHATTWRYECCAISMHHWRWEQISGDHQLAGMTASVVKPSEPHGSWNGNIGDCTLLRHWQPGDNSSLSNADCFSESSWHFGPQRSMLAAAIHANCDRPWTNCCSHFDRKCHINSLLRTSLRVSTTKFPRSGHPLCLPHHLSSRHFRCHPCLFFEPVTEHKVRNHISFSDGKPWLVMFEWQTHRLQLFDVFFLNSHCNYKHKR